MPTPQGITAQRTRRLLMLGLAAVLALALAVAAGFALGSSEADSGESGGPSPTPTPSASPPGDLIKLSGGNHQLDGRYPVNFAHTPQGAVSLVAAYVSNDVTLDPSVKARTRQIYARDLQDADLQQLTENARLTIQLDLEKYGFGVSEDELPSQASMSALPVAAVYEQIDERTVEVAVLVEVSAHDGVSRHTNFMSIQEVRCLWDDGIRGGDWVLSEEQPEIDPPAEVEPHTPEFEDSAWIELQGGVS